MVCCDFDVADVQSGTGLSCGFRSVAFEHRHCIIRFQERIQGDPDDDKVDFGCSKCARAGLGPRGVGASRAATRARTVATFSARAAATAEARPVTPPAGGPAPAGVPATYPPGRAPVSAAPGARSANSTQAPARA